MVRIRGSDLKGQQKVSFSPSPLTVKHLSLASTKILNHFWSNGENQAKKMKIFTSSLVTQHQLLFHYPAFLGRRLREDLRRIISRLWPHARFTQLQHPLITHSWAHAGRAFASWESEGNTTRRMLLLNVLIHLDIVSVKLNQLLEGKWRILV